VTRGLAQSPGLVQRRRSPHVVAEQGIQGRPEARILSGLEPGGFELGQRGHQRLRDVLAAVAAEAVLDGAHGTATGAVALTAAANACSLSGSFLPGLSSTPLATSTAQGRVAAIAAATLSGFRPPLRITGT